MADPFTQAWMQGLGLGADMQQGAWRSNQVDEELRQREIRDSIDSAMADRRALDDENRTALAREQFEFQKKQKEEEFQFEKLQEELHSTTDARAIAQGMGIQENIMQPDPMGGVVMVPNPEWKKRNKEFASMSPGLREKTMGMVNGFHKQRQEDQEKQEKLDSATKAVRDMGGSEEDVALVVGHFNGDFEGDGEALEYYFKVREEKHAKKLAKAHALSGLDQQAVEAFGDPDKSSGPMPPEYGAAVSRRDKSLADERMLLEQGVDYSPNPLGRGHGGDRIVSASDGRGQQTARPEIVPYQNESGTVSLRVNGDGRIDVPPPQAFGPDPVAGAMEWLDRAFGGNLDDKQIEDLVAAMLIGEGL